MSCLVDRPAIKATECNVNNFSFVTSICPKYYCTNYVVPKTVVEKFSFNELKTEKENFSTQS